MRAIAPEFRPYVWSPPSVEVAALAGIDPSQVLRFDQNTPPLPAATTRPGTVAGSLARVNNYPAGGYPDLCRAISDYAGVAPANVVLGAGADDLILLCARAYAGPGDEIAIPERPTYPLFRIAAQLAGAGIGDTDPVLTFACRPNNPTGALEPLPSARPLVVDEAYVDFALAAGLAAGFAAGFADGSAAANFAAGFGVAFASAFFVCAFGFALWRTALFGAGFAGAAAGFGAGGPNATFSICALSTFTGGVSRGAGFLVDIT